MAITEIYRKYFQKSNVFLYPTLGIKKGSSIVPISNYISWENNFKPEDKKLISLYNYRNDDEFINFEKVKLLNNSLFYDFKQIDENKAVYIFDFTKFNDSFENFLKGHYHKMNKEIKDNCLSFYKSNSKLSEYLSSYLYPEKYYHIYAKILNTEVNTLKETETLCTGPDLVKENLNLKILQTQ